MNVLHYLRTNAFFIDAFTFFDWPISCKYFYLQMGSYFGYAVATTDINSDG